MYTEQFSTKKIISANIQSQIDFIPNLNQFSTECYYLSATPIVGTDRSKNW